MQLLAPGYYLLLQVLAQALLLVVVAVVAGCSLVGGKQSGANRADAVGKSGIGTGRAIGYLDASGNRASWPIEQSGVHGQSGNRASKANRAIGHPRPIWPI